MLLKDRQLKAGMKKAKADTGRKEKQKKKNQIRNEARKPVNKPNDNKKKKKAAKAVLSSNYGAVAGGAQPSSDPQPMDEISLGNKRPKGITKGSDGYMYVTEMLYGGIKKVNVLTGDVEQLVSSGEYLARGAYGIVEHQDALFVAGGGVPNGTPLMVYVYDTTSGEEIAACAPEDDGWYLLNDIAILGDYAYVTDSYYNKIMVLNVTAALNGTCESFAIKTPSHLFVGNDSANGKCY